MNYSETTYATAKPSPCVLQNLRSFSSNLGVILGGFTAKLASLRSRPSCGALWGQGLPKILNPQTFPTFEGKVCCFFYWSHPSDHTNIYKLCFNKSWSLQMSQVADLTPSEHNHVAPALPPHDEKNCWKVDGNGNTWQWQHFECQCQTSLYKKNQLRLSTHVYHVCLFNK